MGVHVMPERDANGRVIQTKEAFASKALASGKLFRRKHGFKSASIPAGASAEIILTVPYAQVKINELELVNAREGDTVSLQILDTTTGALTGVPNFMLNQFGFDCELPNGLYRDVSDYDADLIQGMQIKLIYQNNSAGAHTIRGNIIYHELKP